MFRGAGREDNGLAAKGSDLCPADIKDVAEVFHIGDPEVTLRAGEGIPKPCAVYEQRQTMAIGNLLELFQLAAGIDSSVFRGLGDIDEARPDHMVAVRVCLGRAEVGVQLARVHLAVVLRDSQDFVACILDRAGFMDPDMAGLDRYCALVIAQQGRYNGRIGLGPAYEQVYLAAWAAAGLQDLALCAFRVRVAAVSVQLFEIGFSKPSEDIRMGSFGIITSK